MLNKRHVKRKRKEEKKYNEVREVISACERLIAAIDLLLSDSYYVHNIIIYCCKKTTNKRDVLFS